MITWENTFTRKLLSHHHSGKPLSPIPRISAQICSHNVLDSQLMFVDHLIDCPMVKDMSGNISTLNQRPEHFSRSSGSARKLYQDFKSHSTMKLYRHRDLIMAPLPSFRYSASSEKFPEILWIDCQHTIGIGAIPDSGKIHRLWSFSTHVAPDGLEGKNSNKIKNSTKEHVP
ncbi:MAG: hypothetical protein R3B95_10150 [Nitrospirales bacterium]|nr:hypothetical protein [Nitrospirales bacterium]